MNKRKFKKQVKNFLLGRPVRGIRFHEETRCPRNDGTVVITELVPNSYRFYAAIIKAADYPSHWDSPFIVDIYYPEYE